MYSYLITTAYDGSDFAGWAVQPNKFTAQGFIENILSKVFHQTNPPGYRFFFKLSESGSVSYISEKTFYGSGQVRDWLRKIENGTVAVVSSTTLLRNEEEEEEDLRDYARKLEEVERENAYSSEGRSIGIRYDKRIYA